MTAKPLITKLFVLVLILLFSVSGASLTISITGINPKESGNLLVFLYTQSTWMKLKTPTQTIPVTATLNATTLTLPNIESGEYSVRIVHDRDRDGKLSMKWTPPGPTEGYGFSSDYNPTGIPKYPPSAFILKEDTVMAIKMIYPE